MSKPSAFYLIILDLLCGFNLAGADMSVESYRRKEQGFIQWNKHRTDSDAERLKHGDAQKEKRRQYEKQREEVRSAYKRPVYGNDHLLPAHLRKQEEREQAKQQLEQKTAQANKASRKVYEEVAIPMKSKEYGIEKAP